MKNAVGSRHVGAGERSMNYYTKLGLTKEPFSTSPDPQFLYRAAEHRKSLNLLEIAIRLKRGMSLLLGDVGTGKTTLIRALIQAFKEEPNYIFHIILDPYFTSRAQFIENLCRCFGVESTDSEIDNTARIESYLFQKGVIEGKIVVLVVDEGQKLDSYGIEILRTLLNYETNEYKLLQLVIMAQLEFLDLISKTRNFVDRIAFKYLLNPLDEAETVQMILFRLRQAGYSKHYSLFTDDAVREIYNYTKGYPRKITSVCHLAIEEMIMCDSFRVDASMIRDLIKREIEVMNAHSLMEQSPPERSFYKGVVNG